MDRKIYIKDWLELKPYDKQVLTDSYYLKLCNKVKRTITASEQIFVLQMHIDSRGVDYLSCFLTSYFEDIISKSNIWRTFVRKHHRLYKKQLPFYNIQGYTDDEINLQDVNLLIWYFLNRVQENRFISPFNDFILEIAERVYTLFDKEWEYAPENETLGSFYLLDDNEGDFYNARNLIDAILFKTYLFHPDSKLTLQDQELGIVEEVDDDKNIMTILSENRDTTLHRIHTGLLALKGKDWASGILGDNHGVSQDLENMSQRINGYFLYKGQDNDDIFIEHIASGKRFSLTKKSFDHYEDLKVVDSILYMGIVKWKNEWWFSGIFFQQDFNADLILDEKNSVISRQSVSFLDHGIRETKELLELHLETFKEFNSGSQVAFMDSKKIDDFVRSYYNFFNDSLNISKKEKAKAKQRARNDGFFGAEEEPIDYSEVSETGLVFFNPHSGVEIALNVNNAFPLPNNPYFNEEYSEDDIMFLLTSEDMSAELALFCINNCKNDLSFFKKGVGKKYLQDIDFLLRFWKKDSYYSKPSITYTGKL